MDDFDISRYHPTLSDLPEKFAYVRRHQQRAIRAIVESFTDGVGLVILDAPTGSGKTIIAECVRRILGSSASYICTTKGLQDQFTNDFAYSAVLKGRVNYATRNYPEKYKPGRWGSVSCEDCTAQPLNPQCKWCGYKRECPYEQAKERAIRSKLAVLNTAYWLAEVNHIGRFSQRPLTILDEADLLETQLMGYVSVDISETRMEKYGWSPPGKVTVQESWMEWLGEVLPDAERKLRSLPGWSEDVKILREKRYLDNLVDKLRTVRDGLVKEDTAWVYTGRDNHVSFKPTRVDNLGQNLLWKHGSRFLLMSATVISAQQLCDDLGWDKDYTLVRVPSTFPVENRKVYIKPVADMSRRANQREKVIDAVSAILTRHPDERVLVHTVSYDLARDILSGVQSNGRRVVGYTDSYGRKDSLAEFLSTKGSVLIAPSMDRGIDLPEDACRVQVIAKVPFPYLGDRQINARVYSRGGSAWYTVQTIRTLVQMCGRAVRSKDDWAVTYILDSQFVSMLWRRGRGLFPEWWREAVRWEK